jgi:hypothetical protein
MFNRDRSGIQNIYLSKILSSAWKLLLTLDDSDLLGNDGKGLILL